MNINTLIKKIYKNKNAFNIDHLRCRLYVTISDDGVLFSFERWDGPVPCKLNKFIHIIEIEEIIILPDEFADMLWDDWIEQTDSYINSI